MARQSGLFLLSALSDEELSQLLELFRATRKRLSGPQRWTRGALARDSRGREVLPDDARAVRWCVNGALAREAAALEGTTLRWRRGSLETGRGIDDLNAPLMAARGAALVGKLVAGLLALERRGWSGGAGFVPVTADGKRLRMVPFRLLAEMANDDKANQFQGISVLLECIEELLSARVASLQINVHAPSTSSGRDARGEAPERRAEES